MSSEPPNKWTAWTDGASIDNPGAAGLGFVLISPDGSRREGYQGLGTATNNVAELTAILRVAEQVANESEERGEAPMDAHLELHTDSKYSIGVVQQGWKATKNVDLIARVQSALESIGGSELKWVKAHASEIENIVADKLSVLAAQSGLMTNPKIEVVEESKSALRNEAIVEAAAALAEAAKASPSNDEPLLVMMREQAPTPPATKKK